MKLISSILMFTVSVVSADVREIVKSIPAAKIHSVDLRGFNGSEIEIVTWSKEEIAVLITVDYTSSDKERMQEYLKMADLTSSESNGRITLTYRDVQETDKGFSFKKFFSSIFSSYSSLKVTGKITIPSSCALSSDMRYGKYSVDGVKGTLELFGMANGLTVRNCSAIKTIENNYGETTIERSGGVLNLKGASSSLTVSGFNGTLDASADYSIVAISTVTGDVSVHCTGGELTIDHVGKSVSLDALYSKISVLNTGASVSINSQSATIKVKQAVNVDIDSRYSNITVESVTGTGDAVHLKTQSGQSELTNITRDVSIDDSYSILKVNNIAGNILLTGNTTNIQGKKIAGNLSIKNQYATIDIEELTASSVEIINKSNHIRLDLLTTPVLIRIDNEYGSVDLTLPDFTGDVKLRAKYGSISTNLPVEVEDIGGSAVAFGKVGTGQGTMDVTTVSGKIEIRQRK